MSSEHGHRSAGASSTADVVIDFVAGSLGATAAVYVGQPLDTLKVKMQTFPHLYPNLNHCLRKTLQQDGVVRGLYAGTVPSLVANVAENSILFAAYGLCQKVVAKAVGVNSTEELNVFANGMSGFLAAFWSSLALCPTELVKCRLQALRESHLQRGQQPPNIGSYRLTRQILQQEGVRGLFHGLKPTFGREMPGYFLFFFAYEFSREVLTPEGKTKNDIGPWRTIVSGGVAGITLWTAIFPFDVLKSRQQVSGLSEPLFKMAVRISKQEGLLALYNGLMPTLIRTFPATGALFFVYESSKKMMQALV